MNNPLVAAVQQGFADGRDGLATGVTYDDDPGSARSVAYDKARTLGEQFTASGMVSTRDLAEAAGLKTFDTALPMHWYDDVHEKLGVWPQRLLFVWGYDDARVFGEPVALSPEAAEVLSQYEERTR